MVSRPAFMTKAFIVMAFIALCVILYFVFPPFKLGVQTVGNGIRNNLGGWIGAFTASEFYLTLIAPRLFLIGMVLGGLIVTVIAIFAMKGYLNFIKLGRQKSDELAGYQLRPVASPVAIPTQPVTAAPIPEKEPEPV